MKPTPRIRILAAAAGLALSRAAFAQERPSEAACATTPLFCWSTSKGADDRPSTGVDALGSGVALTAIGALSFATAPICKTGVVNTAEQSSCFTV
jgi:hypothetical protein